ncbi:MAG: hypothetical protein KAS78_04595 [Candidatus Pacebacteria bacterium]|nr:hypothetical protein [Candidatus Paceibacterota bacterium]
MKKNKLLISFSFFVLTVLSLTLINKASAQWAPPANIFNLPNNIDQGIINLTNWLLWFVTLLSVVAIIWGGINYIFSSGDTAKADLSKKIIYYALIGLIVAGFAYAIMKVITTVILT